MNTKTTKRFTKQKTGMSRLSSHNTPKSNTTPNSRPQRPRSFYTPVMKDTRNEENNKKKMTVGEVVERVTMRV